MTRVVLDTNIRVSSEVFGGSTKRAVDCVTSDGYLEITSPRLLAELKRTLTVRFHYSDDRAQYVLDRILERCVLVKPDLTIDACRDPDDNRILECAVSGAADAIITGDKDLLVLHPFRGIPILTVRQFLDSLPA